MTERRQEHVWTVSGSEAPNTCQACGKSLVPGDEAVTCPRCKAVHHLTCWVDKGGCTTRGCFQKANPTLTAGKTPAQDPPTKDSFSWMPVALTVFLAILVAAGAVWFWVKGHSAANTLTIMVTAGPDLQTIERVAKDYDNGHDELSVSVLSIPADAQGLYYEQKLVIMLAAKDAPDIIILPHNRFTMYAEQGALLPLDDLRPDVAKAVQYGKRLDNGVVAEHLYGLPHPSQPGIWSIPAMTKKAAPARELLLALVKTLPLKAGINDRATSLTTPSKPMPSTPAQKSDPTTKGSRR